MTFISINNFLNVYLIFLPITADSAQSQILPAVEIKALERWNVVHHV
jgi:hypothetical protein